MHSLLARQLKRCFGPDFAPPPEWSALLAAVDEAYHLFDRDRVMLERSLDLSSQELLQANEEMQSVLRLLPDLYLRLRSDGTILDCNLRLSDHLHAGPGEIIGRRIEDVAPPEVARLFAEARQKLAAGQQAVHFEYALTARGTDRHYEAVVRELPNRTSLALVRDITARRNVEGERDRLVAAIEQAAESLTITDVSGNILYVNPAFSRITGYAREEVVGQNPRILQSGEHNAQFYREMWDTLRSGKVWRGRFVDRRKDGSLFHLESAISPIRDGRGQIVNYVMVGHDVTREMQLEEQLRQSQKMEAIGRLAGGIAHDFNNLLTAIIGNAEMVLARLSVSDPLHDDVEEIRKASMRAAQLTSQLLAFGRRQVLHPKAINLNFIIEEMSRMLRRVLGEPIELDVLLTPDLWAVQADPVQIEQVIMNLSINARDAMPDGGRLSIVTSNYRHETRHGEALTDMPSGEYVRIAVSDNGIGMDPDTRSHLFEPFFTTKAMGKGTGLGLATVYGIVKQSGGHITAESEPGKGATFILYLPRSNQPVLGGPIRTSPAARLSGAETILLVEDEEQVRRLTRTLLERHGYRILEAGRADLAIELARNFDGTIHLMLTDVVMPGINGDVLARRVDEIRPGLRVLFMSGHPETTITFAGVITDGRRFIKKPFSSSDLARKVREVLDEK